MGKKATKRRDVPLWAQTLQRELDARGWKITELARRMGREGEPGFLEKLYKYVRGDVKQPRGEFLEELAAVIGYSAVELRYGEAAGMSIDNVHRLKESATVPILGEVAAGVFREVAHADTMNFQGFSTRARVPPDPRYPADAQYDLVVCGTSINRFAPDNHRLRVLDIKKTGREPQDGEFVIVCRSRDGGQTIETTAKQYVIRNNHVELWPDSDDPRWQEPLIYRPDGGKDDGESVEVIGIVLFAYQTPRTRR